VCESGAVADNLTDAQLDEFRDAFKQFDHDGGGSIDAKELKNLMASVGQMPSDQEVETMVSIADADGSGSIDFPEFVTLMAHKMADVESIEVVKGAFQIFDESGDGYISPTEMRKLMINVGEPVTMADCQALIREVDGNDDGQINFEEFSRVVLSQKSVYDPRAAAGTVADSTHLATIGVQSAAERDADSGKPVSRLSSFSRKGKSRKSR